MNILILKYLNKFRDSLFKNKILFLFLIVLCFLIFFYLKLDNNQKKLVSLTEQISIKCNTEKRISCLIDEIREYSELNPKDSGKVLEIFENKFLDTSNSQEIDALLDFVHYIGMYFVWNNISVYDAFKYCGVSFMQGCIHGVVMQYADNFKIDKKDILIELCETNSLNSVVYLNCLYGVGHVLASKNKVDITQVFEFCDGFENWREKTACSSGFFMEYSKGGAGQGHHSEKPIGTTSLDCSPFNEIYLDICNAYQKDYKKQT